MANVRIRGKIPHSEWPKIAERFQSGETLTEIARSYHCTAPAIRYIVRRTASRPPKGRTERDKAERIAVAAPSSEVRRSSVRAAAGEARPHGSRGGGSFPFEGSTTGIWGRINSDIATFLAAMDTLSTDDSDQNYEALLLATDRLLWASARTRLELERVLNDRRSGGARRALG